MTRFRVAGRGRIDHDRPVHFTFDGKTVEGRAGDTVASALLANGVHLMGRSFKYHRPRGPVSAGSEEPSALIGTRRGPGRFEPNTRATVQEIWNGLEATSQNKYPSLTFDIGAVNDRAYMLFSAGFYYKTFMWPKSFWDKVYEPFIRAAAGLGVSPSEADPDAYASRYLHTDVLVIGAGPAGLAAALSAGARGPAGDAGRRKRGSGRNAVERAAGGNRRHAGVGLARRHAQGARRPRRPDHDPDHRHRLLPPEHGGAVPEAHRPSAIAAGGHAARAVVAGAGRAGRAGARRAGKAAGVRRQRPAGRDAGGLPPRPISIATACASATARSSSPATTAPGMPPSTLPMPAPRSRRSSIPAPNRRPICATPPRRAALRCWRAIP